MAWQEYPIQGESEQVLQLQKRITAERDAAKDGSWEQLVYNQWLKLPQTLSHLAETYQDQAYNNTVTRTEGKIRRHTVTETIPLYRHLAILASHDAVRGTFAQEIRQRHLEKAQRLREEIQAGKVNKSVVIIGAGPNGLTVARQLLAKKDNQGRMIYKPEAILVIEKRDTVGGQFSEKEMMQFNLIMDQEIQGEHVVIQPMDIIGSHMPLNTRYAEMTAANAYFSDVNIALETTWTTNEEGVSMYIPNHMLSKNPTRLFCAIDEATYEITADAVVFAPGMGEGSYSIFDDEPQTLNRLKKEEHLRIWNADEMHMYVYHLYTKLQSPDQYVQQSAQQEAYAFLQGKIAIAGGWKTTDLYIKNIGRIYSLITHTLNDAQQAQLQGSVIIFQNKLHLDDIWEVISRYGHKELFAVENQRITNLRRVEGHPEQMQVKRDASDTTGPIVATVACTSYVPKTFIALFKRIRKANGKQLTEGIGVFNQYRRLGLIYDVLGWRIFLAGPRLFKDKVTRIDKGRQAYERAQLERDGRYSVVIANRIYSSQKGRLAQ